MRRPILALLSLAAMTTGAAAHPHVFVTARSEIVYDGEGRITGVRQNWTFDDMFSAFATQGLDANNDGVLTREELAPLAKVNVDSLKEFDYFTFAKLGGKKMLFQPPVDYWLDEKDKLLTLHFFLPLHAPQAQGQKPFVVEIYDPSYYVAFDMADDAPISLAGAPSGCATNLIRPKELDAVQQAQAQALSQDDFNALDMSANFGANFANRLMVNCP